MSAGLNRATLSSDIDQLLRLPSSTLASLLSSGHPPPTTDKDPKAVLESFSTASTDHQDSQDLARGYMKSMTEMKGLKEGGEIERMGERIDLLRERAEGLTQALGDVKV
ncbi:hypothetical protein IAU60_006089 [Kwoniella sp. DSM 27419]